MRRVVVGGALTVLAVAAGFGIFGMHSAKPRAALSARPQAASVATTAPSQAIDPRTAHASPSRPMAIAPAADPNARYVGATDLYPLAQELRERAERGDVDVVAALAELQDECLAYVMSHGDRGFVPREFEKRDPSSKSWTEAMLERSRVRCQRFNRGDFLSHQRMNNLLIGAANRGSATARARLLMSDPQIEQLPDDVLASEVRGVMASADPGAIADLSNVMGTRVAGRNDRQALFGAPAGTDTEEVAYLIAACRLGLECGADSHVLASLCFNGIGCGYSSVEAIARDRLLTPYQYREMQRELPLILARIQSARADAASGP